MKSLHSFRFSALAAALVLIVPAIHANDATTLPSKFVGVGQANKTYDRFIISYKDGTTERSSSTVVLQNVAAAIHRAGLARATISSTGTVGAVSASYQRKLAVGADLIRTSRKLSQSEANTLMAQLATDPAVVHVQPDYMLRAVQDFRAPASMQKEANEKLASLPTLVQPQTFTPDDTYYSQYQWHFFDPTGGANVNNAWDIADGTGITVAVIDTGVTQHPDLDTSLADAGYDFITDSLVSGRATDGRAPGGWDTGDWDNTQPYLQECYGSNDPSDGGPSSWHGTHVSGTVGEITNNNLGMAGIAYNAKVLPVRVLGHCGGYDSDISDAIEWASGGHVDGVPDNTHVAQVISMSLGGQEACTATSPEAIAIANAISRGTTVVVAAGNGAADVSGFTPASCPGVIAVASNGITGKRAFYSNYGTGIALSAPGGGIYANDGSSGSQVNNGFVWSSLNTGETVPADPTYGGYAGTSQATPHVAGTVAMMLSATKAAGVATPSPADIKSLLMKSARAFPVSEDHPIGAGIVDAHAAVNLALGEDNGGGGDNAIVLSKGTMLPGQNGQGGTSTLYSIVVPAGATTLNIRTLGGTGNVSLYVKAGSAPTMDGSNADFSSAKPGNNEAIVIAKPQAMTYYVLVTAGTTAFTNVSVLADYNP